MQHPIAFDPVPQPALPPQEQGRADLCALIGSLLLPQPAQRRRLRQKQQLDERMTRVALRWQQRAAQQGWPVNAKPSTGAASGLPPAGAAHAPPPAASR